MTDHNIEELQRQYDQARVDALTASSLALEALDRLNAAKRADMEFALAARGIVRGSKVMLRGSVGIFTDVNINSELHGDVRVAKIKKDGSAHGASRFWYVKVSEITLHTDATS